MEQGNALEVYYVAAGIWDQIFWDTPIHVDGKHQKCLVCYNGVVRMLFLIEYTSGKQQVPGINR